MKSAVCARYVPETGGRIDPQTKRLDRSGEGALNQFDTNAVEEALKLRDAAGEGEVVIVSLGPERALEAMRKALAMGAGRGGVVGGGAGVAGGGRGRGGASRGGGGGGLRPRGDEPDTRCGAAA